MSGRRVSLLECIEQAASSASRDVRAQENAVENDEMDDDRSETVGAAIEGAVTNTTDQARQDAAPVTIYPTHDRVPIAGRHDNASLYLEIFSTNRRRITHTSRTYALQRTDTCGSGWRAQRSGGSPWLASDSTRMSTMHTSHVIA